MTAGLLDSLNPPQRQAVLFGDGPLLVLAGAGSGKTRVLTHRLAHLVEAREIPARRLLAFTFTNRAAREMRERIDRLIGGSSGLWVGTFHSMCVRILRRHAEAVQRTSSFLIYDSDDQRSLVKRCLRDLGFSDKTLSPRLVHHVIGQAKNRLQDPDALEADAAHEERPAFKLQVARVYREYERRLAEANAFDFDDLILRALGLLDDPQVLEIYADRFLHVLVDEFQDTNQAQYGLITRLASGHRNLAAVGDDDQSIYSWRGADVANILRFEETYPDASVIRLEQNYRSTRTILRAAHQVVSRNRGRKPKELWTENQDGDKIRVWLLADEDSEAAAVIGEIEDACARGDERYGDCVILYRTHAQSRPIEATLRRRGIPYEIVGGVSFYERREVRDILAYLRLVSSSRDDVSFLRVVNVPRRGIGKTTVERLAAWASGAGLTLFDAACRADQVTGLTGAARRRLTDLVTMFERWRGDEPPVPDLLRRVIADTGYHDHLANDDPLNAESRRENLDELGAAAAHFATETGDGSLAGFLAEVALVADVDALDDDADRLTLMTVHNAKGLEFNQVAVVGLEQGLFPHANSFEEERAYEEERRLFYVALTRARRRVVLSAARRRWRHGRTVESLVSDFVGELPTADLEVQDLSGYDRPRFEEPPGQSAVRGQPGGVRLDPDGDPDPEEFWRLMVGAPVLHSQFGRGVVVGQEGFGPEARVTVRFEGAVTKLIQARFLSPVES